MSAPRRNKIVKIPKPLSLKMRYVRIDTKLLKTFVLMNEYSLEYTIKFHEVDGILTAHLRKFPSKSKFYTRTKREIELIFEGYPPQYVETIRISPVEQIASNQIQPACNQWICIPSPIQERADINRGGWVITAALHSCTGEGFTRLCDVGIGHVMETTTFSVDGKVTIEDFVLRQSSSAKSPPRSC